MSDNKRHPTPKIRYVKRFTTVDALGYAPGPLFEMNGQYGRYILVLQVRDKTTNGWIDVPTEEVPEEQLVSNETVSDATT